ncbi:hypothetical protein AKJ52_00480 [candidate division MSBL1 archaeon SCGC-AAA382C18]|uniref:Transcription regulator TrmB N-terminal domain-containing protein n=1 Tax=candidate division MSBL1 archaeon SCGC-AAA382C18 TaxID=1698281 RepID=A0A133VLH8_9EURY|nr:hypothetical protein AKJ52_00480 [candidate division MSBL1 archaeon SCGC-AAA382C18]
MPKERSTRHLIEILKDFGWTEYEAKCYCTLVEFGTAKAGRIASEANIIKSKVYQPLGKLEDKGYVRTQGRKPKKYSAQNPRYVVESEQEKVNNRSRELLEGLEEAWEIRDEWPEFEDRAWVMNGREGKNVELKKLVEEAKHEIIGFDKKILGSTRSIKIGFHEKGQDIDIRLIGGPQSKDFLKRLQNSGVEVRFNPEIGQSAFYVSDSELVLLCVNNGRSTITFEDENIANIFMDKFEHLFKKAEKVGENA